jgi:hypothetical protein
MTHEIRRSSFLLRCHQRSVIVALLLISVEPALAIGPENKIYLGPALKAGTRTLNALVMLTPTASMVVGGTWTILRTEDSAELSQQAAKLLIDVFTKTGWAIDKDSLSEESVAGDAKLGNLVAFLRERHAQMIREMASRPKDVTKGAFSFGPDVAVLGASAHADALLLADVRAVKPPKLVKGLLAAGSLGATLRAPDVWVGAPQISLIDPTTGDVLCFINVWDSRPDKLSKTLKALRAHVPAERR